MSGPACPPTPPYSPLEGPHGQALMRDSLSSGESADFRFRLDTQEWAAAAPGHEAPWELNSRQCGPTRLAHGFTLSQKWGGSKEQAGPPAATGAGQNTPRTRARARGTRAPHEDHPHEWPSTPPPAYEPRAAHS